jgi:hypothetical protein
MAGGSRLARSNEQLLAVDGRYRTCNAALSREEPSLLQELDHPVHRWRFQQEVSCNVRFGRRATVAADVPCDELQVLLLTESRLRPGVATVRGRLTVAGQSSGKVAVEHLDGKDGRVGEVNLETSSIRSRQVRYRLPPPPW